MKVVEREIMRITLRQNLTVNGEKRFENQQRNREELEGVIIIIIQ